MDRLTRAVIARADEQKIVGYRMAARLGITPGMWSHIRTGRRRMTSSARRRVLQIWPDLLSEHLADMGIGPVAREEVAS